MVSLRDRKSTVALGDLQLVSGGINGQIESLGSIIFFLLGKIPLFIFSTSIRESSEMPFNVPYHDLYKRDFAFARAPSLFLL